jgi:TRAP-type C4-dicarboxylate transport system permease small subunit
MRIIETISVIAAHVTRWLVIGAAAVMIVSLILQIFFRYVIGSSLVWSEELALFLFTWVVLLAGSLGVREGFHVRLTLFCNLLPPRAKRALDLVTHLIAGTFGGLVLFSGYRYLDSTLGQVSAAVRYPIEYLHAAAPVCGALIVLHTLAHLAGMYSDRDGGPRHE